MAELEKKSSIRGVKLEQVAAYLRCDPARLRIALKHLAENPSCIEFSPGISVATSPVAHLGRGQVASPDGVAKIFAREAREAEKRRAEEKAEFAREAPVDPEVHKWLN